jgi:hypothetical protein
MATVNVADFGARVNDGVNDTGAIQSAINAAGNGGTVVLNSGVYDLPEGMKVASNRTYQGNGGTILRGKNAQGWLLHLEGDNTTFKGLTLEGGGLFMDRPGGGMNTNITVDYCVFRLNTGGDKGNGITFTQGVANTRFTNNYFTNYTGAFAIYGYNYNGLTIANNEIVNTRAGFHIDAFGGSGNLLVEQNYISGVKGMGMEFQGTASNLTFQDNVYENPNLSTVFSQNMNSMAYSLILDKSSNIRIRRNFVYAPLRQDGTGCRVGFEMGGDNAIIEDNYIYGPDVSAYMTDGHGTASVTFRNNRVQNVRHGDYIAFPSSGRTYTSHNNGANTQLTWDINRPKPGIGAKRFGGQNTTPPPVTPPPVTPPTVTPKPVLPATPGGVMALATGTTTANLFWMNVANETGYKIERLNGSTWTSVATVGADVKNYTVTGLSAGQSYSFRVLAVNASGASQPSSTMTVTTLASASDVKYVSDLAWSNSTNGWGPAERDTHVGSTAADDGYALRMRGKSYAKGIGVHANSEIKIALDGKYAQFLSDVGIDDDTSGAGSVVFEVWADGAKLYSSGTMTGTTAVKSLALDVSGKKELVLKVANAGDHIHNDHGNWGNARLTLAPVLPPPVVPPPVDPPPVEPPVKPPTVKPTPGQIKYLNDLNWVSATSGWGPIELNRSNGETGAADGKTLTINGKAYAKGLGAHSDSKIVYQLDGFYSVFTADIGLDDEIGNAGTVNFQVWADGIKLYESGRMTGADAARTINVNVQGRQELWLIADRAGDDIHNDHANWADARLIVRPPTSGSSVHLGDRMPSSGTGTVELVESQSGLSLNQKTYSSGLNVTGDSKLVYELDGLYETFITELAVSDQAGTDGSVAMKIYTDGHLAYSSGELSGTTRTRKVRVDVSGVKQLWLVVDDLEGGLAQDPATWAGARLIAA